MAIPKKTQNFHLPLSADLHMLLRQEAKKTGVPATTLAREALESWLRERQREELCSELNAYIADMAGSQADLDEDLERAGVEFLVNEDND
jgi:hypothetical protein